MPRAAVNGTEIWYSIQGEGCPLLLLPGLGLDHAYYRLGEPLLRKRAKTMLLDPRGIGQSLKDSPKDVTYTPELWADDFAALARTLGFQQVDVLGSSLGAATAMVFAEKYPSLTRSLVAIGGFSQLDRALEMNFRFRKKLIAKLGMGEEIADFMAMSTMTREFMENDAGLQVMRANQANVRNNSAELYTAFLDAILWWGRKLPEQENEPLFTTRLKNICCPTLVICGDNDYFIPTFFSKMIADNIPGSVYREIGGGGHIPFIEKPTETAATVLEFLGKLSES
jgi:pimeloyl-ACP methyl ester carboxylesterase